MAIAWALLLLPLAGCWSLQATYEKKAASIAPLAATTIGGVPIGDFLVARTVKLLIAPKPTDKAGVFRASIGCAVPITADGYMLTVAHALEEAPVFVQLPGSTTTELLRVIWTGFDAGGELDLALIHADVVAPTWFEFAPQEDLVEGLPVVSAGFPRPELVLAAGTLRKDFVPAESTGAIVWHSTPLRDGDSGGPLIALDGKLVAVNYGSDNLPLIGQLVSRATRPNLDWLQEIIDLDRRGHQDGIAEPAEFLWYLRKG